MNTVLLSADEPFTSTSQELKRLLNANMNKYQNETTYYNTEASLLWIGRGCIDYFDSLNSNFLGHGNGSF